MIPGRAKRSCRSSDVSSLEVDRQVAEICCWTTHIWAVGSPAGGSGAAGSTELKMFFCAGMVVGWSDECLMALQLQVKYIAASP